MPAIHKDIFQEIPSNLSFEINPYVELMARGQEDGTLPVLYGDALRGKAGRWLEANQTHAYQFNRLYLEIGSHFGQVLSHLAIENPDSLLVGMDITYKRVVKTAQAGQNKGAENLISILGDARMADFLFAPAELDGIFAFFPDPWEKKRRQIDKRLFRGAYFDLLFKLIRPGGAFCFRTDSSDYFEQALQAAKQAGFSDENSCFPLSGLDSVKSSFERKFNKQNLPTYGGVWTR